MLRAAAGVAMLSGGGLLVTAGHAQAVSSEYGWWSGTGTGTSPTDGITVSLAPTVPGVTAPVPNPVAGQFPPALSPFAVGAIRFPAEISATAVLTLDVTASSTSPQALSGTLTSSLLACPIDKPAWVPVQNGSFDKRPSYDCGGVAAVGTISLDGKKVSWELSPIFQTPSGTVNVAIVPAGQSAYSVSFAKPGPSAVMIQPSDDEGSSDEAEPSADASVGTFGPGAVADTATLPDSSGFDSGLVVLPEETSTEPVTTVDEAAAVLAEPDAQTPVALAPARTGAVPTGRDGWRLVFGALLVLMGGGLFWMAGESSRLPQLIGPLRSGNVPVVAVAGDLSGVRGIGRYARTRVGTPRRLR